MARYEITLKDRTVEVIDGADAYQQEGQMTTFFSVEDERQIVDCWSTRLASFRTAEIVIIRRETPAPNMPASTEPDQGTYAPSQAIDERATNPPPSAAMTARSTCGGRVTTARPNSNGKALIP